MKIINRATDVFVGVKMHDNKLFTRIIALERKGGVTESIVFDGIVKNIAKELVIQ
jgi:hypothetical protein